MASDLPTLPLLLPRVRPEFCVYCYAVVNLRLFPELQSRFFWRYTGHRSSLRLIPVLAFRFRPFSETNFSPHSRPASLSGWWANWGFDQLIASAINCSSHCAPCFPFGMVGSNGLGPSTSRLSGVCSNQLSYEPMCGGGNRVRTDDPLLAGQVLYQLSYTPVPSQNFCRFCENKCSLFPGSILFIKNE